MADTKISAMTAATNLTGAIVPIVQGGENKKAASTLFRPYNVYTALLTQTGTDAPIATVLENTLGGTVVWSRNLAGNYTATLSGAFPLESKTFIVTHVGASGQDARSHSYWNDANSILLLTTENTGGTNADDILYLSPIEIRVYP